MPDLVFDLETIPALDVPPGVLPEDRPAALCPPLARVVVAAFAAVGKDDREHAIYDSWALPGQVDTPGEPVLGERQLLKRTAEILARATRVIGFNTRSFDIPTLLHRTLIHKLEPAPLLLQAAREHRYYPNRHIDVLDVATLHGAGGRYSLTAFSLAYGFITEDEARRRDAGADVDELVRAGQTTRVVAHALEDVRLTAALYARWLPVLEDRARERASA